MYILHHYNRDFNPWSIALREAGRMQAPTNRPIPSFCAAIGEIYATKRRPLQFRFDSLTAAENGDELSKVAAMPRLGAIRWNAPVR